MSAGVPELVHPGRRVPGGAGRVLGTTAAPLQQLADPPDRSITYRRTYTTPPVDVPPFYFCPPNELAAPE